MNNASDKNDNADNNSKSTTWSLRVLMLWTALIAELCAVAYYSIPVWTQETLGNNSHSPYAILQDEFSSYDGSTIYVSDDEVAELSQRTLTAHVNGERISDAAITHLSKLKRLRKLVMNAPAVTAQGLKQLADSKTLKSLDLCTSNPRIVEPLKRAAPTLRIQIHPGQ